MKKIVRKMIIIIEILILTGLLVFGGLNFYVTYSVKDNIKTVEQLKEEADEFDTVIILGAQVKSGGKLSKMLKERVDMGIRLYEEGIVDRLLMSGDHGQEEYDEVNAMKNYAIEAGVPSEVIFMDHAGFSTYDTMYRAKEIFQVDKAVVVTQEYHLYRALYNAQALGIEAKGVSCDTRVYAGDAYRKFRESLARIKDIGYCILKPEPKYLGEVIPINGDGDVTND